MLSISQHSRDADLLGSLVEDLLTLFIFFSSGGYYPRSNRNEGNFTVTKFSDIELKIIPFKSILFSGLKL